MADYGSVLSKSIRFCIEPRRWLPLFVLLSASTVLSSFIGQEVMRNMPPGLVSGASTELQMLTFLGSVAGLLLASAVLSIAVFLIMIWAGGAVLQQSLRENDSILKSFSVSKKKYPRVLLLDIVITIIFFAFTALMGACSVLFSLGPAGAAAGFISLAVLVVALALIGLSLFFSCQPIFAANRGVLKSMGESYRIFRKRPLSVFAAALMLVVASAIIGLIFQAPLATYMLYAGGPEGTLAQAVLSGSDNLAAIATQTMLPATLLNIIGNIGLSLAICLLIKGSTEFYLAWRKRLF